MLHDRDEKTRVEAVFSDFLVASRKLESIDIFPRMKRVGRRSGRPVLFSMRSSRCTGKTPTILQATAAERQASCGAFPGRFRTRSNAWSTVSANSAKPSFMLVNRAAAQHVFPVQHSVPILCARKSRSSCAACSLPVCIQGEHFPELVHCAVAPGKTISALASCENHSLRMKKYGT